MSKTYKGYELIKAIADEEIKEETKIEVHSLKVSDNIIAIIKYTNKRLEWVAGQFDTSCLVDNNYYFKVLEDEIDIQNIEELKGIAVMKSVDEKATREENLRRIDKIEVDYFYKINDIVKQQNLILEAVKQLDKKINK